MDEKQLQALANELAKNLKTPEDLSQFDRLLKKLSVEAALNAEMKDWRMAMSRFIIEFGDRLDGHF